MPTLPLLRRLRMARLRVSTAMASVWGLRETTQVMSVVCGAPCSSTVATTHAWPPRRNWTSPAGISAVSAMALRAGGDAARVEARAEDGAGLVAFGAVELVGDERKDGGGFGVGRPESARGGERSAGGTREIAARVGPRPQSAGEDGGRRRARRQRTREIEAAGRIAASFRRGEISGVGRRGRAEEKCNPFGLLRVRFGHGAQLP